MKSLARSYVWWPRMDTDLENLIEKCEKCQLYQNAPKKAQLHPWEWTSSPWQRIHIDFAECQGKQYLIVIDSHSKWLDVVPTPGTTSQNAIQALRGIFVTHGLPENIVSDNATSFSSEEFESFLSKNAMHHITSAPYHPSSNGIAERAVGIFKQGISKMTGETLLLRLQRWLFSYRTTPQSTT